MRIAPRTFFGQPKVRTVGQRTTINRKGLLDPSRRGPEALQEHGAAASAINPSAHNASAAPSAIASINALNPSATPSTFAPFNPSAAPLTVLIGPVNSLNRMAQVPRRSRKSKLS